MPAKTPGPISKKLHAAAAELVAALDALDSAHPARGHVEKAASAVLDAASRIKPMTVQH